MRYVLLKLTDEAAAKFVVKAGKKVLGVWELPEYCSCKTLRLLGIDWEYNPETGFYECTKCGGAHRPYLKLSVRIRAAFPGRNRLREYR